MSDEKTQPAAGQRWNLVWIDDRKPPTLYEITSVEDGRVNFIGGGFEPLGSFLEDDDEMRYVYVDDGPTSELEKLRRDLAATRAALSEARRERDERKVSHSDLAVTTRRWQDTATRYREALEAAKAESVAVHKEYNARIDTFLKNGGTVRDAVYYELNTRVDAAIWSSQRVSEVIDRALATPAETQGVPPNNSKVPRPTPSGAGFSTLAPPGGGETGGIFRRETQGAGTPASHTCKHGKVGFCQRCQESATPAPAPPTCGTCRGTRQVTRGTVGLHALPDDPYPCPSCSTPKERP